MRAVVIVALVALVAFVSASAVVDLTPENFDSVVDGSKHVFVEFFAPWYGLAALYIVSVVVHSDVTSSLTLRPG